MVRERRPGSGVGAQRVTIRDVAAAAGVSTTTVSYVLNDTPGQTIPERTRQRVRQAAASLGYVPHGVARALREGMSRIVLLNVGSILSGHSLERFVAGMGDELRSRGHALLVATSPDAGRSGVPPEAIDALAPRAVLDLPRLLAGSADADAVFGIVDGDHAGLAFHTLTQLRHLAMRGHRGLAFALPDDPRAPLAAARVEHVIRAAAELGLRMVRTVQIDMGEDPGRRRDVVRALVGDSAVTAVAAYDDDVALSVLAAMSGLGARAPDDLAVIGFDDGRHGRLWQPALTTVRIEAAAFGRRAARVVLGLDPGEWVQAPSEVIVRGSA